MLSLSLKYAFEMLKVDRVTLGVFENNMPHIIAIKLRDFGLWKGKKCCVRYLVRSGKCWSWRLVMTNI